MEKETNIINWEQVFSHHKIVSAVKRIEFFSDRMPYVVMSVVQVIKLKRMRWAEQVAHMGGNERHMQVYGGEA